MRLPRPVRLGIVIGALLAIAAGIFFGVRALIGPTRQAGEAQRMMAEQQETIIPFKGGYIASNGPRIRYFGADNRAAAEWAYEADSVAREVSVSDKLVAFWRDDSLHVLDDQGNVTFNGTLAGNIALARCGLGFVAAYLPDSESIEVVTNTGASVDTIQTGGSDVIDIGFFSEQDLMWVLLLDKSAQQPSTLLRILEPSHMMDIGGDTFEDQIVYDVVYNNNRLMTVGTSTLGIVSLTGEIDPKKPLVNGWQLIDTAQLSKTEAALLFTLSGESAAGAPQRLMMVREDGSERQFYLPPGCIAAYVGTKGIWGIAPDRIYAQPFAGQMIQYELPYSISEVVTKLSNNRVVIRAENEYRMFTLP